MGLLINIDNGGTFTDVCVRDGGRVHHAKSPTTPHDLTQCFVDGLRKASHRLYGSEDLGRLLRETDYLRYSTTAGTNAVVERKGVPVALIVEAGAEADAYGARGASVDSGLWQALVTGEPIGLKVGADGTVDADELTGRVNQALTTGAQRLVIALRTAQAETAVKDLLLEKYPRHLLGAVPFLLSHELIREKDAARRTLTALLNSYLHPGMEHFLYGADRVCKTHRLASPLLIFRNDGDSARVARTTAIKTWGSGPRGGLQGTLAYARHYASPAMVAMDIGGTTTDVAVAVDGCIRRNAVGEIEGARIAFPLPDMHSYGLGGSSVIAAVDGEIRVGPESVGAAPGPACFARGGTAATLTDALLLAGVIAADDYLGGELKLDPARAGAAVGRAVAEPLGLSLEAAVNRMIDAFATRAGSHLRQAIQRTGQSPARATLLAFGGGGPMIVTAIADAAGIRRIIVPHMSAVFSAFGIGFSHLAHEYHQPMPDADALVEAKLAMLERARRDMSGERVDPNDCNYVFSALSCDDGRLEETPLGGRTMLYPGSDTTLCLRAVFQLPTFSLIDDDGAVTGVPVPQGHAALARADGSGQRVPVHQAGALAPGHGAAGPALIQGEYLTCLVGAGWTFRVTPNKDILLEAMQ
ncbi:MAG: hydantoinase/oxoprolinase family protein [Gammaproteobacteria bacterium]|nr:hydantoinase/oxoprolinase family protein [Gammaproteobacteria bacterium]